ncbi:hypothetical protein ACWDX6_01840 [Streptomyces sp. NPDC003027]
MTLRVSRDGGRTWSAPKTYRPRRGTVPSQSALRYPPCACPRCVRREEKVIIT